jgi:hypothetical protein
MFALSNLSRVQISFSSSTPGSPRTSRWLSFVFGTTGACLDQLWVPLRLHVAALARRSP